VSDGHAERWSSLRDLTGRALELVEDWEASFGAYASAGVGTEDVDAAWAAFGERMRGNLPFFHPDYAGQMLKPPHPVAVAGYLAGMLVNTNNHALDGGPATSEMEKEVVADLAAMFGLPAEALGHLTASGTIANLEALWVARELHPDQAIAYSAEAHYTHSRMCGVLGVQGRAVAADRFGRIDLGALEDALRGGGIGTVVLTPGTTGIGAVDRIDEALALRERYGVRLHVDGAYGGFFTLLAGLVPGEPFRAIAQCDSVVVDPHKHGLQPYGCGCVLFADPSVGRLYAHDSPYTYFTSDDLHLGEISLECSRAGAAAAALWTTLRALPLTRPGLGAHLAAARGAALATAAALDADPRTTVVVAPDVDIVCAMAAGASAAEASAATTRAFDTLAEAGWHVAKLRVATDWLRARHPEVAADAAATVVLRCCLLKQGHAAVAGDLAAALAEHLHAALP
jgi:glutamate/tyrosine decarboxylase-like PLP-dependent enzyme